MEGEKTVQMFHLVYLNLVNYFIVHSETEMGKGFSDLWLTPNFIAHPQMQHCYLIEFKYVKRELEAEIKNRESALAQKLNAQATEQLHRYASDPRIPYAKSKTTLHLLLVIYCGWEMVACEEVV